VLLSNPRASSISFLFGSFNGTLTYTLFGFLNIYLSRYLKIPMADAMQLNLFGLFAFMLGSPLMGYLFDLVGRRLFLAGTILSILCLAIPIFWFFSANSFGLMIAGQILLGFCVASIAGTGHAAMQTLFPVGDRYRGISFNFSLGMGIFGGITPIIYVDMIDRHQASLFFPAYFLMACTALFGVVLMTFKFFKALKPVSISI
jgi:MFS family permease